MKLLEFKIFYTNDKRYLDIDYNYKGKIYLESF